MNRTFIQIFKFLVSVRLVLVFSVVLSANWKILAETENLSASAFRLLKRSNRLVEKNELEKAIDVLKTYEPGKADYYMIQFEIGNCYMIGKQYNEANKAYLNAIKSNETYGPSWHNLANSYLELDQYEKAANAFKTAYDRYDPKKPDILYYAASSYYAADKPAEALKTFNRLISLHPDNIKLEWQQVRVQILLANDMVKAVLPVLEQLAAELTGDKQKEWQEFLLYHYLTLEMNKNALAYVRNLTKTAPLEIRWWKALAQIALSMDRYKEALVALTVYGHLTPLSIDEKKLMADLYLMLDIPGQSTAILEELLAANTDTALIEKIVYGYTAQHKPEDALKWIEKGVSSDPKNIKLLMLKGEVLFQIKEYVEAKKTFHRVIAQDKNEGKAWLMMGYAAWYGEDLNTAISAMKQAAKFPKQKKAATDALSGLLQIQKQKS